MTTTDQNIVLDVCTPEGKTWLARITGLDAKFGLAREFVHGFKDLTRSGKTGSITYAGLDAGVYESNEGRKRYGRNFWHVTADGVENIDQDQAKKLVKEGA